MMMPRSSPIVTPPLVLRPDWVTLAWLASRWSKLLDLDACPGLTSLCWFCGATDKSKLIWFLGPNQETITVILRPKSPNRSCQFEAQTGKPSILVLRLNQETHAHRLLVHVTDHTWHHLTSRPSGHWVPELCLTIPSPLHQVSYSCLDPHRCPPCCPYHLHTMRQTNMIPHTNQDLGKSHQNVPDSNSNLRMSMTHHNQTKEQTTWFLNLCLDEYIDNKKHKV
jgi:hypothetical protein